jgi:hypothetical protein
MNGIPEHIYEQLRPIHPSRLLCKLIYYLWLPISMVLFPFCLVLLFGICLVTCANMGIQGMINELWKPLEVDDEDDDHAMPHMHGYDFTSPPTPPPSP